MSNVGSSNGAARVQLSKVRDSPGALNKAPPVNRGLLRPLQHGRSGIVIMVTRKELEITYQLQRLRLAPLPYDCHGLTHDDALAARYPGWHCASEPMSSPSLRLIARRVRVTVQVTARWLAVGN